METKKTTAKKTKKTTITSVEAPAEVETSVEAPAEVEKEEKKYTLIDDSYEVEALVDFYDLSRHVNRKKGDKWHVTNARAHKLKSFGFATVL